MQYWDHGYPDEPHSQILRTAKCGNPQGEKIINIWKAAQALQKSQNNACLNCYLIASIIKA